MLQTTSGRRQSLWLHKLLIIRIRQFCIAPTLNHVSLKKSFCAKAFPYTLVGGVRFYERKEIKDILAYIRLLIHPDDDVSRKRAEKIGKTRLSKLLTANIQLQNQTTTEILDGILKITRYLELYDPENEEDMERLENIKELRNVAFAHS